MLLRFILPVAVVQAARPTSLCAVKRTIADCHLCAASSPKLCGMHSPPQSIKGERTEAHTMGDLLARTSGFYRMLSALGDSHRH